MIDKQWTQPARKRIRKEDGTERHRISIRKRVLRMEQERV